MLKLIVFDCDGVMFDSKEANRIYYNDLLAAFDHPPMDEAELSFVHMHNVVDSVNYIFRHYSSKECDQVHRYRSQKDYTPYLEFMIMEPDLVDFLNYSRLHYKLAISTNRTTTMRPLLKRFNLNGYFEKIVTAGDVVSPKPDPEALFDILSFFDLTPAETIYIGDSIVDRQHTASAKVPLIAFKNKNLTAEYHVNSFMEIIELEPFRQII